MPRVIVHHDVQDYDQWKKVYMEHASVRAAAGFTKSRVFQKADNPNNVTVQLDCDDIISAKTFVNSDELVEAMKNSGVIGIPEIYILNDGETFEN